MLDVEALCIDEAGDTGGIRGLGDDADGTAHGGRTEQRTLRTAQHLDALQVEDPWVDRGRHRRVVDVDTGGREALPERASGDAADGDRTPVGHAKIAARAERKIGNGVGIIDELLVAEFLEGVTGQRRHRERHLLEALAAPLCRDDDRREQS